MTYDVWQSKDDTIFCNIDTCKKYSSLKIDETVEFIGICLCFVTDLICKPN